MSSFVSTGSISNIDTIIDNPNFQNASTTLSHSTSSSTTHTGRPRRAAAKKGEKKRRRLISKDKKLGRYLKRLMGTSKGYYKVTKKLTPRQEYRGR